MNIGRITTGRAVGSIREVGAGGYQVTNGALEGWSWGAGNWSSGVEPPVVAFDEVRAPPATATPTATATATPTATPTATATATVRLPQDQTPPQVVPEANTTEVSPGACTLLRWWVTGATELTLNDALVQRGRSEAGLPASRSVSSWRRPMQPARRCASPP